MMALLGLGAAKHETDDTHQGGVTGGVPDDAGKKAQHKKLAYISLGVGVVGALIAYLAYRNQSSAAATTTATPTTSATGTTGTGTVSGYTTDGSQSSYDQAILQALTGLQSSISSLPVSSSPAPVPTPAPAPAPAPSGNGGSHTPLPAQPVVPPSGMGAESLQGFQQIEGGAATGSTWTQLQAILGAHQPVFTQLSPGVFTPYVAGSTLRTQPTYIQDTGAPIGAGYGGIFGAPIQGTAPISGATHTGA